MQCERHGLAAGPDGRCAMCKREESNRAARWAWLGVGATLGLGLVAASAVWLARAQAAARPALAMEPDVAAETTEGEATPADEPGATAESEPGAEHPGRRPTARESPPEEQPEPTAPTATAEAKGASGEKTDVGKEARVRAAMRSVPITMYMAPWCPACRAARAWLQENSIDFDEIDTEDNPSAKAQLRRLNPRGTIPTLDVGGTILVGFSAQAIQAARRRAAERKVANDGL